MGNPYWVMRENVTPTANSDVLTLISASSRRLRLLGVSVRGAGSSSAQQGLSIFLSTAGTTPGGAITPSPAKYTTQPAAVFTTATTWVAQPGRATNGYQVGWNAQGGAFAKDFTPGLFEAYNGGCISIYASTNPTYQAMSLSALVEED